MNLTSPWAKNSERAVNTTRVGDGDNDTIKGKTDDFHVLVGGGGRRHKHLHAKIPWAQLDDVNDGGSQIKRMI